jgi:hypothetical protein
LHPHKDEPIYSQLSFKPEENKLKERMGSCYLDFEVYSAMRFPFRCAESTESLARSNPRPPGSDNMLEGPSMTVHL